MPFYATIKTFNAEGNPTIHYHSFATAEDRAAWLAHDPYDAEHAHRRIAAGAISPAVLASMIPVSDISGPAEWMTLVGIRPSFGADHRFY